MKIFNESFPDKSKTTKFGSYLNERGITKEQFYEKLDRIWDDQLTELFDVKLGDINVSDNNVDANIDLGGLASAAGALMV